MEVGFWCPLTSLMHNSESVYEESVETGAVTGYPYDFSLNC
jgi:hypothetical protein